MPEISIYSTILVVHVLSAVVLIGSALHAPLARGLVRTAGSLDDLRRALEFSHRATTWNPLAALVLLASGIYLGSIGWWSLAWFYVAVAAWIANLVLAVTVIQRTERAMATMAGTTGDGPLPPALDALRRGRVWHLAHAVMLANDLAMVYVMYTKPELSGSLLVVLAALAVAIGIATATSPDRRVAVSVP